MDTSINSSIIEKVVTKKVAIFKAISMLHPLPFEDKFATKETLCQQNEITQNQNSEQCLNKPEQKTEQPQNDITNETKTKNEQENWRTITDPKLRRKMYLKDWYKDNKQKQDCYRTLWRKANKDKIKGYKKSYRDNDNKRHAERKKTDPQYNLARLLRDRLKKAIRGNQKSGSAVDNLGCTIQELKQYLESKFESGMTWDNHGLHGWHIDHIKPLASFDLTDRKQFLEACHYTNLQPLWARDNLSKGDSLTWS